jgi:very-short-patch-repair endonuclease
MEADLVTLMRARKLRRAMSPPEVRLWDRLRAGRLQGLKFRRQHPLGPYILDFYCDAAKLAVEVDSWSHLTEDRPARDARRDGWLASQGVHTLRLPASLVMQDMDSALNTILASSSSPSGRGGS